jgi:hypothetical protein
LAEKFPPTKLKLEKGCRVKLPGAAGTAVSVIKGPVVSGGDGGWGATSSPVKAAGAAKKIIKTALRNPFAPMGAIVMDTGVLGLKNICEVRSLGGRGARGRGL